MSNYSQRLLMNSTIHIAQRRTFSLQRAHNYVLLLYGAKKNVKSLHYHRFKQFIGTVGKTTVYLSSLPPTTEDVRQHAYRVYEQKQRWKGNVLSPTEWGWCIEDGCPAPITTTADPAPEKLLKLIFCGCQIGYMSACSCRRY